jgi:hypothetical protein
MHSSLPRMNQAQRHRADVLTREMGCAACMQRDIYTPADLHHLTDAGRRISHDHTIPLCPYHHRAIPPRYDWTVSMSKMYYGPSIANEPKSFASEFGSEADILKQVNDWYALNEQQVV